MASELLAKWLIHYDPIHRGWTQSGIAHGACATCGFAFPRIRGGYCLRRRVEGVPGLDDPIVGAAGYDATTIRTFSWVEHPSNTTHLYRLFPVGGGGVENTLDATTAEVAIEDLGGWRGRVPNAPTDLRLRPMSGGRFLLEWTYLPEGEAIAPSQFNIYTNEGDQIEYGGVFDYVAYQVGRIHYQYVTNYRAHGERAMWAVRAHSVAYGEETNTRFVAALAQAQPPPINPTVAVSLQ